ncbi:MAG: sulfatase-like hydrolase/transferase [Pirellulales bacterium]
MTISVWRSLTKHLLLAAALAAACFTPAGVRAQDDAAERPSDDPVASVVFASGTEDYHTYRIPALIATREETLLAFCEGRKSSRSDHGNLDLLLRRSTDGGKTWQPARLVYEEGGDAAVTIGNPCPVIDESTGRIWLPFCRNNDHVLVTYSDDDGQTWSQPREITASVKPEGWSWYATGPGVGIQMQHGEHAGRLVIPCDHREQVDGRDVKMSHVFYSDDGGQSWKVGQSVAPHTDECQVVELSDGRLMINMRNYWAREGGVPQRGGMRAVAVSDDGGQTWSELRFDETLIEPVCQASLIRLPPVEGAAGDRLLFSNPASTSTRHRLTVRLSRNAGETWPVSRLLHEGTSAYSCLAVLPDGSIGCLYEGGDENAYEKIIFKRFSLDWLTRGEEPSSNSANSQPGAGATVGPASSAATAPAVRPNILWITADDLSPTLGCYGDDYAVTPHIDRLAREGVRYTRAFATAPVCSPARSSLITGCYAPSLGTHQMRSAFPIPDFMNGFPALLRERGYYTTNNEKTDYNTADTQRIIAASWDESSATAHWRKRPRPDQPFFSVFNLMTSHQSRTMVWPRERFEQEVQSRLSEDQIHDPAAAPVPPYYPDTPLVRRTLARYYDCVTVMDQEVAEILRQLDEDGLTDDTIVFFYSDHGSGLPRHKRALLDTGMHVPLVIRFPERYRHLAPAAAGQTVDRLVSFVDFAPTVLALAGVDAPEWMQGQAFLGSEAAPPREYVYGHRDRVDEALDTARSVRDERYLYIRNYMPHLSYNQPTAWPDLGEIRHEFYRLARRERMTDAQWHFAGPTRPAEELYDCPHDPLNLTNLAGSPQHTAILERMRAAHRRHLRETRDLGFFPESHAWEVFAGTTPWEAARERDLKLEALHETAAAVGVADESGLLANLEEERPAVRYWGAVGLAAREKLSPAAHEALSSRLEDSIPAMRIAAAGALGRHGEAERAVPVLIDALASDDLNVVLHAARTVELMGESAQAAIPAMRRVAARSQRLQAADTPATFVQSAEQDLAMFCGFSAGAFLSRVDE